MQLLAAPNLQPLKRGKRVFRYLASMKSSS
jgi:hypothetical protein